MDMQEYINNAMTARRKEVLSRSDQLTLGELILKLEPIVKKQKDRQDEASIKYDFEYLFPTGLDSWRGSYEELALNYETEGKYMSVTAFYNMLTETVGKTFHGYKGGEYVMNKHTPIWVANYGNSGNTAVVDVVDNDYEVILITGIREF